MTSLEKVESDGYVAGEAAGAWVIDGNSTEAYCWGVLHAIQNCELDIPSPLSGEWAESLTPASLLADYDLTLDSDEANSVLDAWETGYYRGYEDEAGRAAQYQVEDDVNAT